ncbi:MAG: helix-turn-helix domain-containing protein [Caldilineaceae bacterium SB0666_bin_21]|nr:helix-turn-helix domain-containing protein [Caldilineaceae bacterium SB0666_bin_21]
MGICHRSLCRYLNIHSNRLAGQAGACRFVWNHFLSRQQQEYAAYQEGTRPEPPNLSFYGMGCELRRCGMNRIVLGYRTMGTRK